MGTTAYQYSTPEGTTEEGIPGICSKLEGALVPLQKLGGVTNPGKLHIIGFQVPGIDILKFTIFSFRATLCFVGTMNSLCAWHFTLVQPFIYHNSCIPKATPFAFHGRLGCEIPCRSLHGAGIKPHPRWRSQGSQSRWLQANCETEAFLDPLFSHVEK